MEKDRKEPLEIERERARAIELIQKELLEKMNQEEQLQSLQTYVQEGDVTLILGAGSSAPAGIPGWGGLLSQILGHALQYEAYKGKRKSFDAARERQLERELILKDLKVSLGNNYLESGQYVKQLISSAEEDVVNDLLKEIIAYVINKAKLPDVIFDKEIKGTAERDMRTVAEKNTLYAVTYLLKKVRRAITYDYHSLIQECLIKVFQVPEREIVTHAGAWTCTDCTNEIQIFHVHGFIPRHGQRESRAFPKESTKLILSEDSYYELEQREAYSWTNSIQSYYLNRDHCVFVGFSGDDYNFRRIIRQMGALDILQDEEQGDGQIRYSDCRPVHYLFFIIDDLIADTFDDLIRCHENEDLLDEQLRRDTMCLVANILRMKKDYWKRYKVIPVWTTKAHIPKMLTELV